MSKAINPWLKEAYQHRDSHENIPNGIWALIACERCDGATTTAVLLDFVELDFWLISETTPPFEGITGFTEWMALFNPISWGDWLIAPKLYQMHLRTGENLPALVATPDPWIDAVLRDSRGMLMWTHQFIQIIRLIGNVGITQASVIHSSWLLRKPGWERLLEKIYPPTKQTLLQIFEERTIGMQSLGSPDYILADWLSTHFDKTAKGEP